MERVNVYEYYGVLPKKYIKKGEWRSSYAYYMVFTSKEVLKQPERIGKKPILLWGTMEIQIHFGNLEKPKLCVSSSRMFLWEDQEWQIIGTR